ncbi:nucleotide pyrophosphatase/phosphodiesterase family protein [Luteococcus peritonei]|uniref:Nucleotide pyrophosphatase/phosphodiesterase family protein n=1 Tax=Luteococcus peritonei TaxID=88874 RepID=A0ABW4RTD3_9ACTN
MSVALPADWVLPSYGRSTLSDLLPSVGAHLGVPGCTDDRLGLPSARRWVVLLVDGLGHQLLQAALGQTEYFAEVFGDALRLTAGVPSTTATSLTCLGTGLVPGEHGMAGYSFRAPGGRQAMNALTWEGGPEDAEAFQPRETMFERAVAAGVAVTTIGPARFSGSGLTTAALRGPQFWAVDEQDAEARIQAAVRACDRAPQSLTYVYERSLDHTGHGKGVRSQAWLDTLARVDAFAGALREALADDVCLLVTGDHGMLDVPPERHVLVEDHPELGAGVDLLAGEGRLRQLWTDAPEAVARRWQQRLGERAVVRLRDEAVAEGWFGPVDPRVEQHFGDVLVALREDWAVMTRALPRELGLVGQHGSLTSAEMVVPLLVDHPASW